MTLIKSTYGLPLLFLLWGFYDISPAQASVDATCQPLIKSSQARIAKPTWEQTTVTGSGSVVIHMAYANGKSYRKMADDAPWNEFAADFVESEKQMLQQIENGEIKLSNCSLSEGKVIDGKETQAFNYTVTMQGGVTANSTLYIGKADYLPYAQESDKTSTKYKYDNIVIP